MIPITIVITIGGVAFLNAVLFWFMPELTRRDLYFAVTVPPEFRDEPEAKSILWRYRGELAFLSAVALTAFIVAALRLGVLVVPGGILIGLAASFIAFYRARQRVLPHAVPPTTMREANLHKSKRIVPGGWVAASGPFLLLAGCAGYLWMHWGDIPTRFVAHWDAFGHPNRWATRSFATVFLPLLSTAGILVAFTLTLYGAAYWVRPIHAGGRQGASELKFRRAVAAIILAAEYFVSLQSSWLVLVVRAHDWKTGTPGRMGALFPLIFVSVLVIVVALARFGQGGTRAAARNEGTSSVPVGDRTTDSHWKLGVFYFNRDDPSTLIEKRFGLGYTFNFANPTTWVIVSFLFMGVVVPVLVRLLNR
jgi:uncharacterized membrane protein